MKTKNKLVYDYVIGVEYKDGFTQILGAKNLDALIELILYWLSEDKTIKSWTACEYAEAKKTKMTKFVSEVCCGLAKQKAKRKAKKK